jgi:hypothetical protein
MESCDHRVRNDKISPIERGVNSLGHLIQKGTFEQDIHDAFVEASRRIDPDVKGPGENEPKVFDQRRETTSTIKYNEMTGTFKMGS